MKFEIDDRPCGMQGKTRPIAAAYICMEEKRDTNPLSIVRVTDADGAPARGPKCTAGAPMMDHVRAYMGFSCTKYNFASILLFTIEQRY